jgi:hypothetical protein
LPVTSNTMSSRVRSRSTTMTTVVRDTGVSGAVVAFR